MKRITILYITILITLSMHANTFLPSIFSNNMVLQQNAVVKIWGWAKPLEKVTVTPSWDTISYSMVASDQAEWFVEIPTPKAGGPFTITIQGYNKIVLENILLGEVWLCSGQSNMEWTADMGIDNAEFEIANASNQNIRFFSVAHRASPVPNHNVFGVWEESTPESMKYYSAAAYFFAKKLQAELNVPIGLINTSWGGTPIEVWIPESKLAQDSVLLESANTLVKVEWGPHEVGRAYNAMISPLVGYNIAGFLWYQGESNTANPSTYSGMMEALILSWRDAWNADLPFYYAQIAPYDYGDNTVGVEVQNEQRKALFIEETAMIPTSDLVTDISNVHPTNKQDVGFRFANVALTNLYGKTNLPYSGPLYRSHKIEKNKIIVYFDYAEGLYVKNNADLQFEIAGADGKFVHANYKIADKSVIVFSQEISAPVYVRFAWSNTAQSKLFNKYNLPASCFNTKD